MRSLYVLLEEQDAWHIVFYNAVGSFIFRSFCTFDSEGQARQAAERLIGRLK